MSTPTCQLGSAIATPATPSTTTSSQAPPVAATQKPATWLQWLTQPFATAEKEVGAVAANYGLVIVGVLLALGALLIGINAAKTPDIISNIQGGAARLAAAGVE